MNNQSLTKCIKNALEKLYKEDNILLDYNTDDPLVAERCISFRLGYYLQNIFIEYNVDSEYNRHKNEIKRIEDNPIYPDIIIHKRKRDDYNLAWIEIKKSNSKYEETNNDRKRLKSVTYGDNNYGYQYGYLIILSKNNAIIEIYKEGKAIGKEIYMNYDFRKFQRTTLMRTLGMDKYKNIMEIVKDKDIDLSKSKKFKLLFNGFYRVRRNNEWQEDYYNFFQDNRNNKKITFDEILDYMYDKTKGNIEASFCSKMLATINPNMPIWDQYVLKNLNIKVEGKTKEERLENTKNAYKLIVKEMNDRLERKNVQETIKEFRDFFPELDFTDMKILDFLLWNNR